MISVPRAREIILKNIFVVKENELIKIESALGRVCALDIKSKENIPPFDNSAMDGFAVRTEDVKGSTGKNPKILEVVGSLAAGYTTGKIIRRGEAIRIMTGAPLPNGADSVVMVEDARVVHSPQSTVHSK
ncbi:MAG: molybdopterin molybdenumtransferase MoeA, partial [Candidatus Omnitrophota bacterium]